MYLWIATLFYFLGQRRRQSTMGEMRGEGRVSTQSASRINGSLEPRCSVRGEHSGPHLHHVRRGVAI